MVRLLFRSLSHFLVCLFIPFVRSLNHWLSSTRLACHQATFEPQARWPGSSNFFGLPFSLRAQHLAPLTFLHVVYQASFLYHSSSCLVRPWLLAVGVAPSSVGSLRQPLSRLSRLVPQRRGIVLCSSHAVAVVSKRMFVTTITAHVRDVVVHYLCGMCRCCRSHSAASDQLSCSSPVPPSFVHPTAMPSLSHVFVTRCIILATLLYTQPRTNVVVKLPFVCRLAFSIVTS